MRVIGDGHHSPAVMAEVAQCERELAEISNRLLSGRQNSIAQQTRSIRDFASSRLDDIRALPCADPAQAKAQIASHVQTITLQPEGPYTGPPAVGICWVLRDWSVPGARYAPRVECRSSCRWPHRSIVERRSITPPPQST